MSEYRMISVELIERTICRLTHGHEHDKAVCELRALLSGQAVQSAPPVEHEALPAEKRYPSMSLYPDAKEYAAACGEVAGWNACRKAVLASWKRM